MLPTSFNSKTNSKTNSRNTSPNISATKKHASRKITTFFKNTTIKRQARFLNHFCLDSGECLAFGKENTKIPNYFDNFSFKYASPTLTRIGEDSVNGIINEVIFKRDLYIARAVIKSYRTSGPSMNPDNLFYEYFVGNYINSICNMYPCFVETYALLIFKSQQTHQLINNATTNKLTITTDNSNSSSYTQEEGLASIWTQIDSKDRSKQLKISCKVPEAISIMIQHIGKSQSISKIIKTGIYNQNKDHDLITLFYQIYAPLSMMSKVFTHYDLHGENVLVYNIYPTNRYVEYHYHETNGNITIFKSNKLVKIIDYGRAFFYGSSKSNSHQLITQLCKIKECQPNCGFNSGYSTLLLHPAKNHGRSSGSRNISHDLRILKYVADKLSSTSTNNDFPFNNLTKKVHYDNPRGTAENLTIGWRSVDTDTDITQNKILNVIDAHNAFTEEINKISFKEYNDNMYKDCKKMGELHIYLDYDERKPMKFIY